MVGCGKFLYGAKCGFNNSLCSECKELKKGCGVDMVCVWCGSSEDLKEKDINGVGMLLCGECRDEVEENKRLSKYEGGLIINN